MNGGRRRNVGRRARGRFSTDQSQARAATGNWQPRRQSCVKRQRRAERAASGTRAASSGRFGGIGSCLEHRSKLELPRRVALRSRLLVPLHGVLVTLRHEVAQGTGDALQS